MSDLDFEITPERFPMKGWKCLERKSSSRNSTGHTIRILLIGLDSSAIDANLRTNIAMDLAHLQPARNFVKVHWGLKKILAVIYGPGIWPKPHGLIGTAGAHLQSMYAIENNSSWRLRLYRPQQVTISGP